MLTTEKLTLTQNRLTWGVNINTVLMLIDFVLMLTLLCAAVFFERLHTDRPQTQPGKVGRTTTNGNPRKGSRERRRARARADKKSKRPPVGRGGSLGARGDVSTGALRAQYLLGSTVPPAKSSGGRGECCTPQGRDPERPGEVRGFAANVAKSAKMLT